MNKSILESKSSFEGTPNFRNDNSKGIKRNHTLDVAKGIGIILVVLGHNWAVSSFKGELFRVIFSFHMPLFFFLSGIFIRDSGTFKQFALLRIDSLLKPYFATSLIAIAIQYTLAAYKGEAYSNSVFEILEGVLYATGRTILWVQLWFLPHLFIASCAAFLIINHIKSRGQLFVVIAISLIAGVFLLSRSDLPWSVDLLPISLSFLLLGYLFCNFVNRLDFEVTHFFTCLVLFILLHFLFNETIDLNSRIYGSILVCTLQAMMGIYICINVSSLLAKSRIFEKILGYIGSGSLFILLFHYIVQEKIFNFVFRHSNATLFSILCGLVSGIAIPLVFWEIVKREQLIAKILLPKQFASRVDRQRSP